MAKTLLTSPRVHFMCQIVFLLYVNLNGKEAKGGNMKPTTFRSNFGQA
jgi:hypothetical protein